MTGRKIAVSHNSSEIEAAAAYDSSYDKKSSTIIVGNWGETGKNISVTLKNLPETLTVNDKINVKVERIPESLAIPLYEATVLNDCEYDVEDGTAVINFVTNGRDAIAISITPIANSSEKIDIALTDSTYSDNITVTNKNDAVYAENGKTSSYTNDTPVGNEASTSYKDTGDYITFSSDIAENGLYKFEGVHITGADMGFMQLYIDGEAFGEPTDLYSAEDGEKTVDYGSIYLTAGKHDYTFRIVGFGKNKNSAGTTLTFKSLSVTPIEKSDSERTVYFDTNGGGAIMTQESSVVNDGDTLGFVPTPERKNYKFISWDTAADGNGDTVTENTIINSDMTVYAQWEKNIRVELAGDTKDAVLTYENDTASITINAATDKIVTVKANRNDITDRFVKQGDKLVLEAYEITEDTIFVINIIEADSVKATVIEGNSIILPEKVMAAGDDNTIAQRSVTWDYSTITSTGKKHIDLVTGTFDGGTVIAEVTVLPCTADIGNFVSVAQNAGTQDLSGTYKSTCVNHDLRKCGIFIYRINF